MTPVPSVRAETDGALFDRIDAWLARYVAYPHEHARHAHVAWIVHTHLVDCFDNSPRLAFLSPEPGSGKSRALEVTEPLVMDAVYAVNVSVSYLFRRISVGEGEPSPTVLFDEVDSVFNTKGSESTEELRGILNSGYRRGAFVGRAVVRGKEVTTEDWSSFGPVAMAGLNALPDTLMTRSVVVQMRRRSPSETIEPYRRRTAGGAGRELRDAIASFALGVRDGLVDSWPDLPAGIVDRNADVWEPLIAIGDAGGGRWPDLIRDAAVFMVEEQGHKPATLGIRLLADIRAVFTATGDLPMRTVELVDALVALESAPWGNIKGQSIDARFLARMLTKYEIQTNNTIRFVVGTGKGYAPYHFADAWDRYLPPTEPALLDALAEEQPF